MKVWDEFQASKDATSTTTESNTEKVEVSWIDKDNVLHIDHLKDAKIDDNNNDASSSTCSITVKDSHV